MALINLPRALHPDFCFPEIKPVFGVKKNPSFLDTSSLAILHGLNGKIENYSTKSSQFEIFGAATKVDVQQGIIAYGTSVNDSIIVSGFGQPQQWTYLVKGIVKASGSQGCIATFAASHLSGEHDRELYINSSGDIVGTLFDASDTRTVTSSGKTFEVGDQLVAVLTTAAGAASGTLNLHIKGLGEFITAVDNGGYSSYSAGPVLSFGAGLVNGAPSVPGLDVEVFQFLNRALTDGEIEAFFKDPFISFAPAIPIYINVGIGGAGLVVQNISQSNQVANTTLSEYNQLPVNEILQSSLIGNVDFSTQTSLIVQGMLNGQIVGSVGLTQYHLLVVDDITQPNEIDSPSLSVLSLLVVQSIAQSQGLDNVDLVQAHNLIVQSLSQNNLTESTSLIVDGILTVQGLTQAQLLAAVQITQHYLLVVNNLAQIQSLDNASVVSANVLSVVGITQDQIVDSVDLVQANILTVQDITQSQLLDLVNFGNPVIGVIEGQIFIYSLIEGELSIQPLIDGDITIH